jgi:hypothetical protein
MDSLDELKYGDLISVGYNNVTDVGIYVETRSTFRYYSLNYNMNYFYTRHRENKKLPYQFIVSPRLSRVRKITTESLNSTELVEYNKIRKILNV